MPARAKFMRGYFSLPLPPRSFLVAHASSPRRQSVDGMLHMHAPIDMNAPLHTKRPRCYLIPFSFRLRKVSGSVVASIATLPSRLPRAETHRADP